MPRIREFRWDSWANRAMEEFLWQTKGGTEPLLVAVDTETTGVEFYDEPFAATITWRDHGGRLRSFYFDLADEGWQLRASVLRDILRISGRWVGHNLKFDLQKLLLAGVIDWADIHAAELHDTQTMYVLLDENSPKGLKKLAVSVLRHDDTIEVAYKSGPRAKAGEMRRVPKEEYQLNEARRRLGLKKEDGYHLLPREVLIPYALRDTEFTLRLYEALAPRLAAKDAKLNQLYRDSMELKLALLEMEADGLQLDLDYLRRTSSEWGVREMEAWQRVVEVSGLPDLNLNSPAQIIAAFTARGVYLEDTQESTLASLDDELARAILEYREAKKIHTTYLVGLLKAQREGIAHPNFNDDGAKTGRMSSGASAG